MVWSCFLLCFLLKVNKNLKAQPGWFFLFVFFNATVAWIWAIQPGVDHYRECLVQRGFLCSTGSLQSHRPQTQQRQNIFIWSGEALSIPHYYTPNELINTWLCFLKCLIKQSQQVLQHSVLSVIYLIMCSREPLRIPDICCQDFGLLGVKCN